VKVNLKSGVWRNVPWWRSNVPRLLNKILKEVTGKIVPRWNRNVPRWIA